jgi:hypothetical protein
MLQDNAKKYKTPGAVKPVTSEKEPSSGANKPLRKTFILIFTKIHFAKKIHNF